MNFQAHFPYKSKKIVFAVLDWGLGHAARSLPIIEDLISKENKITIASSGRAFALLQKEIGSQVDFLDLESSEVKYRFGSMILNMVLQLPKLATDYIREKRMIDNYVKAQGIDLIISDHRYSCYNSRTENIFIAHQLTILAENKFFAYLGSRINVYLINKFDKCMVPDNEGTANLSGKLSQSQRIDKVEYIGAISRLKPTNNSKEIDILIILSGPEPARSNFEKRLLSILEKSTLKIKLIRGQSNGTAINPTNEMEIIPFADTTQIQNLINKSRLVVARSGYSTLMDLHVTQSKALLVPTPGQTEQEYLAEYHKDHKRWTFCEESELTETHIDQLLN